MGYREGEQESGLGVVAKGGMVSREGVRGKGGCAINKSIIIVIDRHRPDHPSAGVHNYTVKNSASSCRALQTPRPSVNDGRTGGGAAGGGGSGGVHQNLSVSGRQVMNEGEKKRRVGKRRRGEKSEAIGIKGEELSMRRERKEEMRTEDKEERVNNEEKSTSYRRRSKREV